MNLSQTSHDQPFSNGVIRNIVLILFLMSSFAWANIVTPQLDSLLVVGKENIYDLRFNQADSIFSQIRQEYPEYPHGYVYQAYITVLNYTMDQSNKQLDSLLDIQVKQAQEIAKKFKDENGDNPESHFMQAMANGIRAVYHVVNRNFIRAYWSGRSTKKGLEKAVKLDSTYYDAYIGLGMFHYYADLLPGALKFFAGILGFGGDRELGKQEVRFSADKGRYFQVEGRFIYHCIEYFLEGEKRKSIASLEKMYREYPGNQAIGLIIAYHYRRTGYLEKCLNYCQQFTDEYSDQLPQLTNLKYYNMAVCYYDLNDFQRADSIFTILAELPTRKSPYYQAAIYFYQGHLKDFNGDREKALSYYSQIKDSKQTQYWYLLSRMYVDHPVDTLMQDWIVAQNYLGSRKYNESYQATLAMVSALDSGAISINPNFPFLVYDLLGRNHHYKRRLNDSRAAFETKLSQVGKMKDNFRKAWYYIHYSRCLRQLNEFDLAEKYLNKANDLDDSFTKIIIQREKYMLSSREKKHKERQKLLEQRKKK